MTDKLSATMQIAERVYSLAQEQDDPALMIGAYALWQPRSTFWAISSPRDNTRCVVFRSGAREASSLMRKTSIRRSSAVCAMRRYPSGISERSPLAKRTWTEAISLAKELNDMNALALALDWAAGLAYFERNPAEVDRLASDLIELSTRHNFVYLASARSHLPRLGAQRFR